MHLKSKVEKYLIDSGMEKLTEPEDTREYCWLSCPQGPSEHTVFLCMERMLEIVRNDLGGKYHTFDVYVQLGSLYMTASKGTATGKLYFLKHQRKVNGVWVNRSLPIGVTDVRAFLEAEGDIDDRYIRVYGFFDTYSLYVCNKWLGFSRKVADD